MTTRILIAEDDPVSRLVLEESLANLDCDIVVCSDGAEAWDILCQQDPPELAILDWMMPGMDGPEISRRLRKSENPLSTYVILLTVRRGKQDKIEGLQAGADDYITKPVDFDELRARIRVGQRLVELQRQQVEQETAYYVEQLEQAVEELQKSRSRVVAAQEEVRRAIAEELHGHVQTQMAIQYFKLQDIQDKLPESPEDAKAALAEVAEELDNLRENTIRQISHRLHPSVIRLSLTAGLQSLRDQCEESVSIELDLADELQELEPAGGSSIPLDLRLGFYRVAEEALGNVIKHAKATKVTVRLWTTAEGKLCLLIEDNGKGFVPEETKGRSLGLVTIMDYIGAIRGTFEVDSAPGKGTRLSATAPLDTGTRTTGK